MEGRVRRVLAVTNMYPTPPDPTVGTFVEQQVKGLRQNGVDVEVLLLNRAEKNMTVYLTTRRRVRAAIMRFKPDIVHAMYGGIMADQVTRAAADLPTVVTFHGSDLLGEHLSGFIRETIANFGVRCSRRAAQRASGIIVVSTLLLDALSKKVDRSKVRVIPCGIDLARFKPIDRSSCRERLGWNPDRFHILFPGSRNPVKRPALARAAVRAISDARIWPELHYLRGVPNDQVPVWLNASDVLLMTSLHEGSPTIVKEALACNLPIVSVDVGDVADRIEGIDGCYIALAEPLDIASKLCLVHHGPRRIEGHAKMQSLSLERIAQRIKEVYDELLAYG
jgi:teichuronic acid biosynthesis glycosyltransferase TuaC